MKNKILKATACVMTILFIVSGCALDSDSIIPAVVCMFSILWLCLFVLANKNNF